MKRPMVNVALLYAVGLLLARFLPAQPPLGALFLAVFAAAALALIVSKARPWLIGTLLVFTGWTNLAAWMAVVSPHDLRVLVGERTELAAVRGTLVETPDLRYFERDEEPVWRAHAVLEVSALRWRDAWQPATGKVAVLSPGVPGRAFFSGQEVIISGVLFPPKRAVAEGLFDYRNYLRWQGIHYQLRAEGTNGWQLAVPEHANRKPPWPDRFITWAQPTLARGLPEEDKSLRLVWAMTLGWRAALTDEVSEPFMRSGTMHIFAISGLHIALIAGILVQVLRVARVPRGVCGLVIIPLIWFYTAATGWQASAIRSTIMMTVIIAGWSLRRPSDLLNSLAASGFIILVWQPQQLFQASFQLSFFVVLSLALLLPPFEKLRSRLLQSDPLLPTELRPRWQQWLDAPLRFVTTAFATSLAAWIGSLPLIAYYFHLFTPGSLIANLLVVPVSSLALMCNLGALFCGDWLPWLTELFNHSGWFWMRGMDVLSAWATTLPGSYFYVRSPTGLEFLIYYSAVFVAIGWRNFSPRWRFGAALGLASLCVGWSEQWFAHRHDARLTVLAGAPSIFADRPGQQDDLLVDSGNESGARLIVVPLVRGQGINRLPSLVLTHGDAHHVGGALRVQEQLAVHETITSPARFQSATYRSVTRELEKHPERLRKIARGGSLHGWEVLHPAATDKFSEADDLAVVLRVDIHGARLLLLSDLGKAGQSMLLEREKNLRADIVVAGMPNHSEPLREELLDAIQPRVIVIQDSEFPASLRATRPLRERLARRNVPVLCSTDNGAVTITIDSNGWTVRSMKGDVVAVTNRAKK